MKSVRLDAAREARLREAARTRRVSQSEFIRQAIDKACDDALGGPSLYDQFKEMFDWFDQPADPTEPLTDTAERSEELWGNHVVRKHARYLDTAQRILREQRGESR